MANGVVIHLDDNSEGILIPSKNLFDQLNLDLEYITCDTKEAFEQATIENESTLKALIFDLLSEEPSKEELDKKDAQFLKDVRNGFAKYNIPIFIYSGFLQKLDNEFEGYGTVFKADKEDGPKPVFDKLKLLWESGFIDVFCPGGVLETQIKEELHNSFVRQFTKNEQIEEVIKSISEAVQDTEQSSDRVKKVFNRVKKVFKRIAIKTLASDLLAPVADREDNVHPVEHFYKRQSKLPLWTGDIWSKKEGDKTVLILTPRCDFATGSATNIIFCDIEESSINENNVSEEKLKKHLDDNLLGKKKRYIPSFTYFPSGGMVNLASHETIGKGQFVNDYKYIITLSDDLTNEIIGKFAYYFLRTGITNTNVKELKAVIKAQNSKENNGEE